MKPVQVYLSRRNLLTLLSKLDRKKKGEETKCTIIKRDNQHTTHSQNVEEVIVTAVEDEVYYADRPAGAMLPADDPQIIKH